MYYIGNNNNFSNFNKGFESLSKRQSVMARARKKVAKKPHLTDVLTRSNSLILGNIRLSISSVAQDNNLIKTNQAINVKSPEVSNAKFGGGALAYKSSSWLGGDVFVGKQLAGENAVIRLSAEDDLDTLECMVKSAGDAVDKTTCSKTRFGVLVPCPSELQNVSTFKNQLQTVPKKTENKEKNTVIDSASLTRMLQFVHPENDQVNQNVIKGQVLLKGTAADRLLKALIANSLDLKGVFAKAAYEAVEFVFKDHTLGVLLRNSLKESFRSSANIS